MKISKCLNRMSKMYLNRILNSFSRDIHNLTESEMREFIAKNYEEIIQPGHIEAKLDFSDYRHKNRMLLKKLLEFMLEQPERQVLEKELFDKFSKFLKNKNKIYKRKSIYSQIPDNKIEVIKTVFEVILEDQSMSIDEEKIIQGLKNKLNLTDVELYSILNKVKKVDEEFEFSNSETNEGFKELQNKGLVYFVSKNVNKRKYVIPDEISEVLMKYYDYPLTYKSFELLFDQVNKTELKELLDERGLTVSKTKDEMIKALYYRGYNPRKLLSELNKTTLSEIAKDIDEVKSSSKKDKLVEDILSNYFYLNTEPIEKGKVSQEQLWEYYTDFAQRKYGKLRQLKLIKKDLDIESTFEKLTTYAFSKLLGNQIVNQSDSNHSDGMVKDSSGDLLMWDNKSQESPYRFPLKHRKQFLQYVVKAKNEPDIFLVITGEIDDDDSVEQACIKLSADTGTNFAVISSQTFKEFVDDVKNGKEVDLQVFNYNGVITPQTIDRRHSVLV